MQLEQYNTQGCGIPRKVGGEPGQRTEAESDVLSSIGMMRVLRFLQTPMSKVFPGDPSGSFNTLCSDLTLSFHGSHFVLVSS